MCQCGQFGRIKPRRVVSDQSNISLKPAIWCIPITQSRYIIAHITLSLKYATSNIHFV
jgi:hypothetical protein